MRSIFEIAERNGLGDAAELVVKHFIASAVNLDQFALRRRPTAVAFEFEPENFEQGSYLAACARNAMKEIEKCT